MEIKTWIKPALIVLVRSNPEEAVLTACKQYNNSLRNGSTSTHNWCATTVPCVPGCDANAAS
jgi:hypothetical protein